MGFTDNERSALLAVKGVGPTVVTRLEQLGFTSLAQLGQADMNEIVSSAAAMVGSGCWKIAHKRVRQFKLQLIWPKCIHDSECIPAIISLVSCYSIPQHAQLISFFARWWGMASASHPISASFPLPEYITNV